MTTFVDWVYWLALFGVLAVNGALVYLAWWGLFSDRAKGRRRCPRCWYDLAYSPGMTCAECGFTAQREAQLYRTRRRYRVSAAAILASVLIAIALNNRITQRGVPSMLPTRLLLWMLPLSEPSNNIATIYGELLSRTATSKFSDSQWQTLIERCAQGDWWARPVSDDWIAKYGRLISNWRPTFVDDAALEAPLSGIPPRIDVTTRETWPQDLPIVLAVQVRDWWPWGMECRIRATPRYANTASGAARPLQSITFYRTGDDRPPRSAYALHLPPLDQQTGQIVIDFEIDRRRMSNRNGLTRALEEKPSSMRDESGEWERVAQQTISLSTRAQGALEQLIQPVDDPLMAQAMARVFANGAVKWPAGPSTVRFQIDQSATHIGAMNDTAVGVSAELLCDDMVARRLNLWWIAGLAGNAPMSRQYGFEIDYEDSELLQNVNAEDGRWRMRVRSDPRIALRAGTAPKHWSGEFTVPLKLRLNNGSAPPRAWWTQE
jgi:hypothetical protein